MLQTFTVQDSTACAWVVWHWGPVYTTDHWSRTMEDGLFYVRVQGPILGVWLLKKVVLKALGSWAISLRVNRMWTKKNDHTPKTECGKFLIHAQKGQFWRKIKFDHFLVFFSASQLSSLLVKCVEDVACKSSYNKN